LHRIGRFVDIGDTRPSAHVGKDVVVTVLVARFLMHLLGCTALLFG
jgi:hypothetical protein